MSTSISLTVRDSTLVAYPTIIEPRVAYHHAEPEIVHDACDVGALMIILRALRTLNPVGRFIDYTARHSYVVGGTVQARITSMSDDTTLDLSRYKTSELASTVAEILAVPASVRTVLKTTCLAILLLLVANSLIYAVGNPDLTPWLLSTIYALVLGVVLGFALGLIRVADLILSRSERVLQLTLEISQEVATDYEAIRIGGKRLPTSTQVVEHVYDRVVLPAMEATIANSFGPVGRPLLSIYRRTIGGCVRFLITRMKTASLPPDAKDRVLQESTRLMGVVGENQSHIRAAIQEAQGYTEYAANMVRKMLLYPIQLAFLFIALLAIIPLGLCWYWTR